ncbi:MAG: hypothetical protein BM555_00230 [Crocinitomix sp. MedPE-SWsnd]|nr:MAG: hypothetical protein BM555_00230 [Crocinitomix sp. MedPE-SWsnd]
MKSFYVILLISITTLLSSCFEIIEDVSLNEDGSGTFKYIVNFSQSAPKVKSMLLMDEVEGVAVPTEAKMKSKFEKICLQTKKAKGISGVTYKSDFENYIFNYSCNFKKTSNLNAALDSIKTSLGDDSLGVNYFNYSVRSKKFKRRGDNLIENLRQKMSESQQLIFSGAKYTCLYRFFDEISNIKPEGSKLSANKKTSFKQVLMSEMIHDGHIIDQEIQLK